MVQRLRELLKAQPFVPFTVTMSSGEQHEIRHPENALMTKYVLIIVDADDEDRVRDLYLLHVAALDRIAAKASSTIANSDDRITYSLPSFIVIITGPAWMAFTSISRSIKFSLFWSC